MRLAADKQLRGAYTLLELMIALGLLGALMSVAWSLMSTFRDAEERGWKITRRTQVIRAAHAWLQSDAQHMSPADSEISFSGNSLGFTTVIAPSLDPLPFLQQLMSESSAGETTGTHSALESEETYTSASPWPAEQLEIEYELIVIDHPSSQGAADNRPIDEIQFTLVRRELLSAAQSTGGLSPESNSTQVNNFIDNGQAQPASERVLTGQDLYRQNDERSRPRGVPVSQSRLEGLVRPQFQYCDGQTWKSQWNSRTDGGFPAAIALRFDFPARALMQPPTPRRSDAGLGTESEVILESPATSSNGLTAADMALASEEQAQLETDSDASLMESGEFEVQLVVRVAGSMGKTWKSPDVSSPIDPDGAVNAEYVPPLSGTDALSSGSRGGY